MEALKFSASFSDKLTGGARSLPSQSKAGNAKVVDADDEGDAGPLVSSFNGHSSGLTEVPPYDPLVIHKTEPWRRALVNDDSFDLKSKGRNLLLGHTLIVPLVPLSLPLSLPLIMFSVPMWVIPPVLGGKARRVRLMRDKGDWINKFVRSPLSPMSGLFTQRRSDPIEAMQRRPWMVMPLKVTGPMSQPHPSVSKIPTSELTGGVVLTDKLMQMQTGEILNYLEVRAGAHSKFSSVGVMTQESYETSDPREFDSSGIPSGTSVCYTGTGALFWNMAETEAENAQLSEASASERAVHVGDRVGILVDIAVGSMAILKNGKQVLLRKGLPVGQSMRFFVGCSKVGTSWTIVPSRKARESLKHVDWDAFYSKAKAEEEKETAESD